MASGEGVPGATDTVGEFTAVKSYAAPAMGANDANSPAVSFATRTPSTPAVKSVSEGRNRAYGDAENVSSRRPAGVYPTRSPFGTDILSMSNQRHRAGSFVSYLVSHRPYDSTSIIGTVPLN